LQTAPLPNNFHRCKTVGRRNLSKEALCGLQPRTASDQELNPDSTGPTWGEKKDNSIPPTTNITSKMKEVKAIK
jgi:hypothetical protein